MLHEHGADIVLTDDKETHGILRLDLAAGECSWAFLPAGGACFRGAASGGCDG